MKMEDWHSEWVDHPGPDVYIDSNHISDSLSVSNNCESIPIDSECLPEQSVTKAESLNPVRDSNENVCDEFNSKIEKNEEPQFKTSLINTSLAKKRLQAYSKQNRKSPTKEEIVNIEEKRQKHVTKKAKKGLYPDEKAKAVIQEIEEIKRRENELVKRRDDDSRRREAEDFFKRQAVANAIKSIQVVNISQIATHSPERNQQFKRREIKQRNYRRTDSGYRRSNTPEEFKHKRKLSPSSKYPKNWSDLKKQNLSIPIDDKSKYPPRKGSLGLSSLGKLYNFDLPPALIEPYVYETENGPKEVPPSFLKITRSKPFLIYSVNSEAVKESFLSRDQLFGLVSSERQRCINSTINNHAKFTSNKKIQSQSWYSKLWRKSSIPECKILENSVGLSFLQNYSDEDEENETEEILICSSIRKSKTEVPPSKTTAGEVVEYEQPVPLAERSENIEKEKDSSWDSTPVTKPVELVLTPERNTHPVTNSISEEDETGILTPDISSLQLLKIQQSESDNKAQQKPEEKVPPDLHEENNLSDSKKKKKKTKRKMESTQLDEDVPKKKKKKKAKSKKPKYSEESDSSEDEKRKRKKQKKVKNKEKSNKRKRKNSKAESSDKLKKKADIYEQISLKKRAKKKRRKSTSMDIKSPLIDDLKKSSKKKNKKKKREQLMQTSSSDHDKKSNKKGKLFKQVSVDKTNISANPENPHGIDQLVHADGSKSGKRGKPSKKSSVDYDENAAENFELEQNKEKGKGHHRGKEIKSAKRDKTKRKIKKEIIDYEDDDSNIQKKPAFEQPLPFLDIVIKQEPKDDYFYDPEDKNRESKPKTPDTNEYKGNWEKEVDPLWESEEERILKQRKLNSSWESDEDIGEPDRGRTVDEFKMRSGLSHYVNDMLDLEIPLNIKPFKKREILDFELELPVDIKKAEVDIDKSVVRKLQLPLVQDKDIDDASKQSEKKRRWDKKEIQPKIEKQTSPNEVPALNNSDTKVLENEYEEFMKAVSANSNSSPNLKKTNASLIPASCNDSKNVQEMPPVDTKPDKVTKKQIIAAKDIPFIPMPDESIIQPVPFPAIQKPLLDIPIKLLARRNEPKTDDPVSSSAVVANQSSPKRTADENSINVSPNKTTFSLVLPSKKTLIVNSNLKLGDSDDEVDKGMKPIGEVRKDLVDEQAKEEMSERKNVPVEESNPPTTKLVQSPVVPEPVRYVGKAKSGVSPRKESSSSSQSSSKYRRRESSPRRRGYSPRRDDSPRRRRRSPERYRDRGRTSPGNRRYSSRRSHSPNYRKRSPSPRRRSPKRSISPRSRSSRKSTSRSYDKPDIHRQASSPLQGPKRSVADSTISDDSLLPQPSLEEYIQSPAPVVPHYFDRTKFHDTKRLSLDERLNIELGLNKGDLKPITTTYNNFCHNDYPENSQFSAHFMDTNYDGNSGLKSNFVQLENMVQIVPADFDIKTDKQIAEVRTEKKSQILQIGNVLEIVPTELPPEIPLPPPPPVKSAPEKIDVRITNNSGTTAATEKPSAETSLNEKLVERRAEREKRRQEREARRKEKENRRREKEKLRQVKMKQKTENMIKKALQLDMGNQEGGGDSAFEDTTPQWPPLLNISGTSKDLNRSILVSGRRRSSKHKRKIVQFADGVKPGEGTSPSAGEDLTSPPPCKILPKEKRYTKTKLRVKNVKKKVKVKIIKSTDGVAEGSDDEDSLPPPSPPPGSPPPHLFPPRIKPQHNATAHCFVPNVANQNTPPLYRTSVNVMPIPQTLSHSRTPFKHLSEQQAPLPDSPMQQVHSFAQYQVPPLSSVPPPPPPAPTESPMGTGHRSHHFNNKYSM